jgi:hypothetical protein
LVEIAATSQAFRRVAATRSRSRLTAPLTVDRLPDAPQAVHLIDLAIAHPTEPRDR